jgi:type VI protein secretion system component VasF
MNKPKCLELIWLTFWMMPPIVVAAITSRYFRFNFLAYFFIAILALVLWLGMMLGWSWLTSARNSDTQDNEEAR